MKKYFTLILFIALTSICANAQLLVNYTYKGTTVAKSEEDVAFKINWTVTYEASWKLFFSDDQKIAVQKRIKNSVNSKLTILFSQYTSGILVSAGKKGIQGAVDNPNFVDALAGEMLTAFAELFSGNIEEVPEFNVLKLKLDNIYEPTGYGYREVK